MAEEIKSSVVSRKGLEELLNKLNITAELVEHEEVFTVEAMIPHLLHCNGIVCKNLFVKDKKKRLWLVVAKHDQKVSLNDVAKRVNAKGGLRFADENLLLEKLGVVQGCVTPLAICNDTSCSVTIILDSCLISDPEKKVYCHPLVNNATIGISSSNLLKFLKHFKHEPVVIDFTE